MDDVIKLERGEIYRIVKQELQDEWRDRIFERDGEKCRICGASGADYLHLAHITSVRKFLRASKHYVDPLEDEKGLREAMTKAYRPDNLVTLCSTCHLVSHGSINAVYDSEIKKMMAERENLLEQEPVRRYVDLGRKIQEAVEGAKERALQRSSEVSRLFSSIKKERGWKDASHLIKLEIIGERDFGKYHPKASITQMKRHMEGICEFKAKTCMGKLVLCPECNRLLCEYHFPFHISDYNNEHR